MTDVMNDSSGSALMHGFQMLLNHASLTAFRYHPSMLGASTILCTMEKMRTVEADLETVNSFFVVLTRA